MQPWISEELQTTDLGDRRLDQRFARLLDQLSSQPQHSIPTACGGGAEIQAAYRFFDNPKVTPDKVLASHHDATRMRCRDYPSTYCYRERVEVAV